MQTYISPEKREFKFNDHVCMEMMLGVPDEKRTGRLVQVRKGCGAFGMDVYILRLRTGTLAAYENVLMRHADDMRFERNFYLSNGQKPPDILPQEPYNADTEETEYLIGDRYPETGFIIEHPKQPASAKQSFAMTVQTPPTP